MQRRWLLWLGAAGMGVLLVFAGVLVVQDRRERYRFAMAPTDPALIPFDAASPPNEWKVDEINNGLPYRWEKGTVYVLVWETTEDVGNGERSSRTQILVLKHFDEPTEKGGFRWVLAHLYHRPKDKDWPWKKDMLHIPPFPRLGEKMPNVTDAELFGHEFYKEVPTDKQIEAFLCETGWASRLGEWEAISLLDDNVVTLKYVTTLVAGGIDRMLWKKLFGREAPANLFSELTQPVVDKK
jgi:hypothetical protein